MYLGRNPAVGTQRMLDSLESQFNGTLTTFDLRYGGVPTYPTLSESLIVSLGGVLQEPGEAYYVSSDKIVFSEAPPAGAECWILLYSQYGAATSSAPSLAIQATGEPMGFENRTHSTISFNNGTRTFSIAPNTSGGYSSYVVWTKGTKRTITTTLSVQVGTTTGLYYIYFDAFGDLKYKTTYFTWDTETMVAYVYWNSDTSSAPFIADERHGVVLDWQTHEYLHRTRGAVIAEGFSISNYTTTGNGSVDAHAQFDLGNGTFFDEDLEVNITHSATPTAGTFTQVLTGGAEIPVFYLSGSSGAWVRDSANKYACKQSATTLQYNSLSGSTWSTSPADNNRYVVSWIAATNDINAPVICILGQEQYTAIGTAEAVKFGNLTLTNFPIVEFRPLWKVIFQTSTGFTNTPNALIANVLDLRQLSETGEAGTVVSDHGLLSGLTDDDHSQYLHATLSRSGITANISTTGNLGGANLTLTGELRGPSNFIIDPAVVGNDTGTVEIKGNLIVQGTTTTINSTTVDLDHLSLGDNEVANFGNSDDLKIYHNATDNYFDSTTVNTKIFFRTSNSASLDTNAFSILANGNVGIGTANPQSKIHVSAESGTASTGASVGVIGRKPSFNNSSSDAYGALNIGDWNTLGQRTIVSISSRQIGNPGGQYYENGGEIATFRFTGTGTDSATGMVAAEIAASSSASGFGNSATSPSDLIFKVSGSGGTRTLPVERLRITGSGNVGIGTTSPNFIGVNVNSRCLSIVGDGTTTVARGVLELRNPIVDASGNTLGTIYFSGGTQSNYAEIRAVTSGVGGVNGFGNELRFATKDDNGSNSYKLYILSNGNIGIGTATTTYKLEVNGSFAATTKSFLIPHPTKENYKLRHGSLEGPENGVYVRGRSNSGIIELPEYWTALVDPDSITVSLTPIGPSGMPRVERIENNKVYIFTEDSRPLEYFYIVNAERIDVEPLEVEILDN